jgi:hypothetical protein
MKTLLLCENFYSDIDSITVLIKNLEFIDSLHGQEIDEFQYIPQDTDKMFSHILRENIDISHDTGKFRKPNSNVYFDNFYEHSLWSCIVALEDTELKLHSHIETGSKSFFDLPKDTNMDQFFINNCSDQTKWNTISIINIPKNGFVFLRPWLWRSLKEERLVQTFMLNAKLIEKE